VFALQIAAERH